MFLYPTCVTISQLKIVFTAISWPQGSTHNLHVAAHYTVMSDSIRPPKKEETTSCAQNAVANIPSGYPST